MTRAVGVISGTSMDGIDVALLDGDGETIAHVGPGATYPYPADLAERLRAVVADPARAAGPLDDLERDVTDAHVAAVEAFLRDHAIARESLALVGLHGQTVLHRPEARYTRQLCDGARAARRLDLDVVCDFRSADVAAGGEGAPLVPLYHAATGERARAAADVSELGRGRQRHLSRGVRRDRRLRHRPRQCADRRFRQNGG